MTVAALFLVNAGLSFALSLAVAALLGPDTFGRYALASSIAVVVNTLAFEWLRLSTARFYSERSREERPEVRATLRLGYATAATGLGLLTFLAIGLVEAWGGAVSPGLIAAIAVAGLSLGLFEFGTALARARFLDGTYAVLVGLRAVAACGLASAAAWLWADPAAVLATSALAAFGAALTVARRLADPAPPPSRARRRLLAGFARYGLPLVVAGTVFGLLPVINRALLARQDGFAEAGYFALASEIAMRLFQNLGSALDAALFQLAVRADERLGRAEAERQISRNIAIMAALILPAAAGLWTVLPSFEAVFVPTAYAGRVAPAMALVVPSLAAFALVQYALAPAFQLGGRTAPVVAAALAALVVDVVLVEGRPAADWLGLAGSRAVAAAQLAAMLVALAVAGRLAGASGTRLPWRDLAVAASASVAMALAIRPLNALGPSLATLALQVAAGLAIYLALGLALDLAGLRAVLTGAVSRNMNRCPTA